MRWIGVAIALGLGMASIHVEPVTASFALIMAAVVCLYLSAPWRGAERA